MSDNEEESQPLENDIPAPLWADSQPLFPQDALAEATQPPGTPERQAPSVEPAGYRDVIEILETPLKEEPVEENPEDKEPCGECALCDHQESPNPEDRDEVRNLPAEETTDPLVEEATSGMEFCNLGDSQESVALKPKETEVSRQQVEKATQMAELKKKIDEAKKRMTSMILEPIFLELFLYSRKES